MSRILVVDDEEGVREFIGVFLLFLILFRSDSKTPTPAR